MKYYIKWLPGITIIVCWIFFIILILLTRGRIITEIFFCDIRDTYMDFFNSVYDASMRRPYELGVIYPPLCYIIFYLFNRFVPEEIIDAQWHISPGGNVIKTTQGGQLALFIYLTFIIIFIFLIIFIYLKEQNILIKISGIVSIFLSIPFLYSIERGNIILYSFAGALFFCLFFNSKNKIAREMALVALAFSAGIKIYPAILGLLLLLEKRYRDAFRCIIYGISFFFLPFIFFGGVKEVWNLIDSIQQSSIYFGNTYGGVGYKINFENTLKIYEALFGIKTININIIVGGISLALFFLSIFQKTTWKRIAMLLLIIIGTPAFSYNYTSIFLIIPWIMLFSDNKFNRMNMYYFILLTIILLPIPLGVIQIDSEWPLTGNTLLVSTIILLLAVSLIVETIVVYAKKIKNIRRKWYGAIN